MRRLLALIVVAITAAGCGGSSSTPSPRVAQPAEQSAGGSVHPPGWGEQHAPQATQLAVPLAVGVATMYDSTELSTVPPNPFALAGYTSGHWPTYLPMRQTWPNAHTVSIDVTSRFHGDCLDIEPGDAAPWQAPAWVRADRAAGFARPCLYSSYWEFVHEVRPALARAGISRGSVWEWDADYTFRPHIDVSFDGTQWTDVAFGRNLDASVVTRPFLSIAQPPLVEPNDRQRKEARLALLRRDYRSAHCTVPLKRRKCIVWATEARVLVRELAR